MQDSEHNQETGVLRDRTRKIEHYERRFGLIAIEKGFICATDLVRALTIQVDDDIHHMRHRLIGEILFDLCLMTDKEVECVLSELFYRTRLSM